MAEDTRTRLLVITASRKSAERMMMKRKSRLIVSLPCAALILAGCSGGSSSGTNSPAFFALSVASVNPVNSVIPSISPADDNSVTTGTTNLTLIYKPATTVMLTAGATSSSGAFYGWTGCDTASGVVCTVAMNASRTVTAQYAGVTDVLISPSTATVAASGTLQFSATVNGLGSCTSSQMTVPCAGSGVTYTVVPPSGYTASPGTVTATGLYTAPSPAPTTVTVMASSILDPSVNSTATVNIQ